MRLNRYGNYVVRGQARESDGPSEINLYNGTYLHGFRLVDIKCAGKSPTANNQSMIVASTLSTNVTLSADRWKWQDQHEVGWASSAKEGQSSRDNLFSLVDSSIIVVDKLYIYAHATEGTDYGVNYYVELEPVSIDGYEYTLSYLQNGRHNE